MSKIKELVSKHGARVVANTIVNKHISSNFGLSKDDLPDTEEMVDIVDEIEDVLNQDEFNPKEVNEILIRIDLNFIQELVFH